MRLGTVGLAWTAKVVSTNRARPIEAGKQGHQSACVGDPGTTGA